MEHDGFVFGLLLGICLYYIAAILYCIIADIIQRFR